jgi:hypothetical protein
MLLDVCVTPVVLKRTFPDKWKWSGSTELTLFTAIHRYRGAAGRGCDVGELDGPCPGIELQSRAHTKFSLVRPK